MAGFAVVVGVARENDDLGKARIGNAEAEKQGKKCRAHHCCILLKKLVRTFGILKSKGKTAETQSRYLQE
jgi:hypothetical protein